MEKFLTIDEIAEILKISYISASRLLKRNKMGFKADKRVLVSESEFKEFLQKKKAERD